MIRKTLPKQDKKTEKNKNLHEKKFYPYTRIFLHIAENPRITQSILGLLGQFPEQC